MSTQHDNSVELEAFFPDVEPELPRCPTPVIEMRIRDAVIEACERAHLWRWGHPEILVSAGLQEYDFLTPAADLLVHSVISLSYEGHPLDGAMCNNVDTHDVVRGRGYDVLERGRIRLARSPIRSSSPLTVFDPISLVESPNPYRQFKGIEALLSIKPSRSTLHVSEVFVRDYYQLIVSGTLAKAFGMADRPWTNPELAQMRERDFEVRLGKAKQGVDIGFRTGSQRFRPRKFA